MKKINLELLFKRHKYEQIISQYNSSKNYSDIILKIFFWSFYYLNYKNKALEITKKISDLTDQNLLLSFINAELGYTDKAKKNVQNISKKNLSTENKIFLLFTQLYIETNSLHQDNSVKIAKKILHFIEKEHLSSIYKYKTYRFLSIIYLRKFDFQKAVEYAQMVINSNDALHEDKAFAFRYLAIIYSYKYNYYTALIYFHQSLNEFRKANSLNGMLKTYSSMAFSYINMGELEIGYFFSKKALDIAQKTEDELSLGKIYNRLGHYYILQNNYEEAEISFKKDYEITKKLENPILSAYSARNLGRLYKQMGKEKQAQKFLKESLSLFQATDDVVNSILTKIEMLDFEIIGNTFEDVENQFYLIIKPIVEGNHYGMLAHFYLKMAKISESFERINKAIEYLHKAEDILQVKDNIFRYIELLHNLAKMYYQKNDIKKARYYIKKNYDLLNTQHIKFLYDETIQLMGEIDEGMLLDVSKEKLTKSQKSLLLNEISQNDIQTAFENYYVIGKSKVIKQIIKQATSLATIDAPILIKGESGVGKEIFAKYLYYKGVRKGNFIVINCGALSDNLIESELFGYRKGSFSGAFANKIGKIKAAQGGCVFFDEIDKLSLKGQAALLRLVDNNEIQPVGAYLPEIVDVRLIFATNKDLAQLVSMKKFLEDLYYRINNITIYIPPLRERREDIPLLVKYYINVFNKKYDKSLNQIEETALELLINFDWPGNIRQLKHTIEHLVITKTNNTITKNDLLNILYIDKPFIPLEEYEKQYIKKVLQYTNNNKVRAAKILGIHRNTLLNKLKEWGEL